MYFKQMDFSLRLWQLTFSALLLGGGTSAVSAVELLVKPERCIALNQGQVCYQKVLLQWQTEQNSSFCLRLKGEQEPLQCWQEVSQGSLEFDVQSKVDQGFELVGSEGDVVAVTQVEIAWVYKNRNKRQTSWRLF